MSAPVSPASRQSVQFPTFVSPDEPTISADRCECDERERDCSCLNASSQNGRLPGVEDDPRRYRWVFLAVTLPFIIFAGVAKAVIWYKNRPGKGSGGGVPLAPGPLMILMVFSRFFRRGRDVDNVTTSPTPAAAPPYANSAAQIVRGLIDGFNSHIGQYVPSYEAVEGRLLDYDRNSLRELTPNARAFYIQHAIDRFVERTVNRYDAAAPATAPWLFDAHSYVSDNPVLLQSDRRRIEALATRYTRIAQEHLANLVTRAADEKTVRAQFRAHFGNESYFNDYLGSMALRTWNMLSDRQRSWLVSKTVRELDTNIKKGEIPPLFMKWFLKNVRPKLVEHLERAWAAMPEVFRGAMGKAAVSSDPFPAVFYEMMLALDPTFEQSFPQILTRDTTLIDWANLPQTAAVVSEKQNIVRTNPGLAPYSSFVTALAEARLAVAQNTIARTGGGSGGEGSQGPSAERSPESPATGSSGFSALTLFSSGLWHSVTDWFSFQRGDESPSVRPVSWRIGSRLVILPHVPRQDVEIGEEGPEGNDARWRNRTGRTGVPSGRGRTQTPNDQRTAGVYGETEITDADFEITAADYNDIAWEDEAYEADDESMIYGLEVYEGMDGCEDATIPPAYIEAMGQAIPVL